MSENGLYDDRLDKVMELLRIVDEQTKEQAEKTLPLLESIALSTKATASSNSMIASTLDKFEKSNRHQVQIIAGKWQVPMPVFLIVAVIFAVWMVAEKAAQTKTEVKITPSEFSVGHNDRRDGPTSP